MTPHGEPHNSLDQAGTEPKTLEPATASETKDGRQRTGYSEGVDRGVPARALRVRRQTLGT